MISRFSGSYIADLDAVGTLVEVGGHPDTHSLRHRLLIADEIADRGRVLVVGWIVHGRDERPPDDASRFEDGSLEPIADGSQQAGGKTDLTLDRTVEVATISEGVGDRVVTVEDTLSLTSSEVADRDPRHGALILPVVVPRGAAGGQGDGRRLVCLRDVHVAVVGSAVEHETEELVLGTDLDVVLAVLAQCHGMSLPLMSSVWKWL
jgi:hypothetical protein